LGLLKGKKTQMESDEGFIEFHNKMTELKDLLKAHVSLYSNGKTFTLQLRELFHGNIHLRIYVDDNREVHIQPFIEQTHKP
jgi:hypothetical protein